MLPLYLCHTFTVTLPWWPSSTAPPPAFMTSGSYAVAAIRFGDDIKTVQGNLGHATAAFAPDVYGHVTAPMKRESAARMEGYIANILNL